MELEVTETEPGVKGDTATGATKPAIVETGASVLVPLFVNQGDKIKIDTRTGEYMPAQEHNPFIMLHKIKIEIKAESRGKSSCFRFVNAILEGKRMFL